jgi:hypothetical protein
VINASAIRDMLTAALAWAGLTDPATGGPLHFTPMTSAGYSSPTSS